MKIRITRETIFEVLDDIDLETLESWVHHTLIGAFGADAETTTSWCILTPEGLPIAPSQYPKRQA